jgi:XTP/dITP diphosphohydrolase
MKNLITIVIASKNIGKIAEIENLLSGFPVIIKNLDDFGTITSVEEDRETFIENACKKAQFAARLLGLPVLADDSGLMVEALGGAPGIRSARYAGENASDEQNRLKLLKEMEGKRNRRAVFRCAISIAVPSGSVLTYEADCEGRITERPAGYHGFGYDSIFYYPPLDQTFGQLTMEMKRIVSHRGKAFTKLLDEFDNVLSWIRQNMTV